MAEKLWNWIWSDAVTPAERQELSDALAKKFAGTALGWAPLGTQLKVALGLKPERDAVLQEIRGR